MREIAQDASRRVKTYLPFLLLYFAFGLTSAIDVAVYFWQKDILGFSPIDSQLIGFWAGVPWMVKILFGQCIDKRPLFGSQRQTYIFVGATCVVIAYLMFMGIALNWSFIASPGAALKLYYIAAVLAAAGLVLQDAVADAMKADITPKNDNVEARTIQMYGQVATSLGMLIAAACAGGLAILGKEHGYHVIFFPVFLATAISIIGAILWRHKSMVEQAKWNVPILASSIVFALLVLGVAFFDLPAKAEIVWGASLIALGLYLFALCRKIDREEILLLLSTVAVVFVFRSLPGAGVGYRWWQTDVLQFDETFFGLLQIFGCLLGFFGLSALIPWISKYSVAPLLGILTVFQTVLSLPPIGMFFGLHHWTESHFGFGARMITFVDLTISSPFGQISMVPMQALFALLSIRFGSKATLCALTACIMYVSMSTSTISTNWLAELLPVWQATGSTPADYSNMGPILIFTTALSFAVPLLTIFAFRRQLDFRSSDYLELEDSPRKARGPSPGAYELATA